MRKSAYELTNTVPLPQKRVLWSRFPFAYMEVGESFFVRKTDEKKTSCLAVKGMLWYAAQKYMLENSVVAKYAFQIDLIKGGVRCFRIE